MIPYTATACSCSNIAFIKYWGNRDDTLRLPANGSISMNLSGLETVTTVRFSEELTSDTLSLNGQAHTGEALGRASRHLDHVRRLAGISLYAEIRSRNNFPTGAGIASSASAFAALTVASCAALGLDLTERELSALARLGSGSACRSVPGGYVEWHSGNDHASSYAETIAPPTHWELLDLVAIISGEHKAVGSTSGHSLAPTSPLQTARVEDAPRRLDQCRDAILRRDFELLAEVIEQDALMMHAVMMTSRPPLLYWLPTTLQLIQAVREWRAEGIPACFTIDAGPNVHIITLSSHRKQLELLLHQIDGVQAVLAAPPGGPTRLINEPVM